MILKNDCLRCNAVKLQEVTYSDIKNKSEIYYINPSSSCQLLVSEIELEFKTLSGFQADQQSLLFQVRHASSDGVRSR